MEDSSMGMAKGPSCFDASYEEEEEEEETKQQQMQVEDEVCPDEPPGKRSRDDRRRTDVSCSTRGERNLTTGQWSCVCVCVVANASDMVRVQIRTPDGARLVRRMLKSDPVQHLFIVVRQHVPNAKQQKFHLRTTFPSKQVDETVCSIESAGLINASLVMQWAV